MCRQEIPHDFVEKPTLIDIIEDRMLEYNYEWYYEGRNGWWQYDERTSKELETAYKNGERSCELLVAGFLYVMDLDAMLQLRRNDPSRRRRIKRDLANIDKIGIAGLRCPTIKNAISKTTGSNNAQDSVREMSSIDLTIPGIAAADTESETTDVDDSQRTIIYDSPLDLTFENGSLVETEDD